MSSKKVQIGFRVTEALQKRIETGCISRGLTLQDLITAALDMYLKTPKNFKYMAAHFATAESESDEEVAEHQAWTGLWMKYMSDMPREKSLQMAELMKLDLLHYKSSRRKKKTGD